MASGGPHLIVNIDTKSPIEIGDFVSVFTSVASQYQKHIRERYPAFSDDATIFVREVRPGSIEADLIPAIVTTAGTLVPVAVSIMDGAVAVEDFVRRYAERLVRFFSRGGQDPQATHSDLKDFMGQVAAIANDPNGTARIEAVTYEDGHKRVRAALRFSTSEARQAAANIERQQRELENKGSSDHQRVLMVFTQSNVKNAPVGKRTGEWVRIEEVSEKDLPLIYASDLAEQRIKHEIREADDNVFKKGFVVDVNVATKGGRPAAYRVTNLHQVIDLPDDA